MFISRKLVLIISAVFFAMLLGLIFVVAKKTQTMRTLTLEDLPKGVILVPHVHPKTEIKLDENGEPTGEMIHYATPEAIKNGGPIYGVYGYVIVSIEYEIPESRIGLRMVGKDFPGWGLAPSFLGLVDDVPQYDHFHVGLKNEPDTETSAKKTYLIHLMLLSHEEELNLGLSCG